MILTEKQEKIIEERRKFNKATRINKNTKIRESSEKRKEYKKAVKKQASKARNKKAVKLRNLRKKRNTEKLIEKAKREHKDGLEKLYHKEKKRKNSIENKRKYDKKWNARLRYKTRVRRAARKKWRENSGRVEKLRLAHAAKIAENKLKREIVRAKEKIVEISRQEFIKLRAQLERDRIKKVKEKNVLKLKIEYKRKRKVRQNAIKYYYDLKKKKAQEAVREHLENVKLIKTEVKELSNRPIYYKKDYLYGNYTENFYCSNVCIYFNSMYSCEWLFKVGADVFCKARAENNKQIGVNGANIKNNSKYEKNIISKAVKMIAAGEKIERKIRNEEVRAKRSELMKRLIGSKIDSKSELEQKDDAYDIIEEFKPEKKYSNLKSLV